MEVTPASISHASGSLRPSSLAINGRLLLMLAITLVLLIPVIVIVSSLANPLTDAFKHLVDTLLQDYIVNSLILMVGVAIGTFTLGTSTAWLTSMSQFPGRRFFEWALLLPMAFPAYIIAYTYTDMLDFFGPVQVFLRHTFGWQYGDYYFPEIRSIGGAICMLSLVLYPYVYLIVRTSFREQSHALLEVSRSLGNGPWRTFFFIALPAARPAIVAGMTLALMETLADYGTVQFFGVSTFTTGIFRTWFGMGDLQAAAQLASMLLIFVCTLMMVERWSRARMSFQHSSKAIRNPVRDPLPWGYQILAIAVCSTPLILGFVLPVIQLVYWLIETWQNALNEAFFTLVRNSFTLAAIASLCCLAAALTLTFSRRILRNNAKAEWTLRAATVGYAVPGTVIAVGVLIPLAWIDNRIDGWFRATFDVSTGLILSGTIVAVIFAYLVRFISVSVQTLESGYAKIPSSVDDCARSLGVAPKNILQRIHIPILKTSILTAILLVFVDVLKELPTTLILRPFNFNTLAVRAHEFASDERLSDAAAPAIAIVLAGLIPVIILSRTMGKSK